MTALGIDYGGTQTKLLLVDGDGGDVARSTTATRDLRGLGDDVAQFVESAGREIETFAVTVAGTLDPVSGVVGRSTNLPWLDGTAPASILAERLGVPGQAVQDGEAAALAEAAFGAGRGGRDVFVLALGTGIAGAHVVDGVPRRGAHGAAGEVGHMTVADNGVVCSCGQTGCLETVIGGHQLAVRWRERGGAVAAGASARDVVRAAAAGDAAADAVLRDARDGLARALLTVCALVDPAVFVIGGGVARSPERTVWPAVDAARRSATFHTLGDVREASLGVWAGARGAAAIAQRIESPVTSEG